MPGVLSALQEGREPTIDELLSFIHQAEEELQGAGGSADERAELRERLRAARERLAASLPAVRTKHPLEGATFPVDRLVEAAPHLRRPFTPEAVKWKVQNELGNGAIIVAYIDVRLVVDRLNMVIPHRWRDDIRPVEGTKLVRCVLEIDGVPHVDVGEGAGKAGYSDALKRAAVKFGIGVPIYALPQQVATYGAGDAQLRKSTKGKPIIDDRTRAALLRYYKGWLETTGIPTFGPPLDHGDTGFAQGYDDEPEQVDAEPVAEEERLPPLPEDDELARNLRERIHDEYDALRAEDPMRVPPGTFNARLERAQHSYEALNEVLDWLTQALEGRGAS